ncbi:hypothetical protein Q8A67_022154 [Cirrhinus molitorella]|uniref:Uncharacterized protein n=1 Tax=Cirrhinus molitorella TaxID=172907 RepID=A0AA88P1D7_9TELE|nr:hypothetical protein Q8A67_022154 [Cirrhinus molitorella]
MWPLMGPGGENGGIREPLSISPSVWEAEQKLTEVPKTVRRDSKEIEPPNTLSQRPMHCMSWPNICVRSIVCY